MINIILGPSCIGKSYFIDKIIKSALTYVEDTLVGDIWTEDIWSKNVCIHFAMAPRWVNLANGKFQFREHLDSHGNLLLLSLIKKISELKIPKSVIILGIPYSEYTDRVKKRRHKLKDYDQLLQLYIRWISELNINEIPYLLVEAIKDYKVLKEKDFFKMIR